MDIIKEQIDELNAQLKIQLTEEDLNPKVETIRFKEKAHIKRFQTRKSTYGFNKKMYGKSVMYEEVNKFVSETLNKLSVSEEKLEYDW